MRARMLALCALLVAVACATSPVVAGGLNPLVPSQVRQVLEQLGITSGGAYPSGASQLAALTPTANQSIVGNGTAWVVSGTTCGQQGVGCGGTATVTNSLTLDSSYQGKVILFTGTAASTITLPTASAGAIFTVVYQPSSGTPKLKVQVSAAGQFIAQGALGRCATGGYWQTATVDSTFTVVGVSTTVWVSQGWDGVWGKDN